MILNNKRIALIIWLICASCIYVIIIAANIAGRDKGKEYISSTTEQTEVKDTVELGLENTTESKTAVNTTTEKTTEKIIESETPCVKYYTDDDAIDIAKLLYKECGGVTSDTEKACVAWCVLNRVDQSGDSIHDVIRSPNQFAFSESTIVRDDLLELSYDVLDRWNKERNGITNSGRVLPLEYMYFYGDGVHNYFRNAYCGDYDIWDYSLESPYKN